MDSHDVQLLAHLYWKQKAAVRHNGEISEWMRIKQGVRQGCVAFPHLFAMYTEMIMIRFEDKGGFRMGGRAIINLRYADDTVIIAKIEHELHHLMGIVVQEREQKGLFLNIDKSYTMVFSKSSSILTYQIKFYGKPLE